MRATIKEINVVICGVGGQGNVLLENILGMSAMKEGYAVKGADTFGTAQRGGSVLSHLRVGSEVYSSLVPQGRCHIILGLEPGEALNAAVKYICKNGLVIVNSSPLFPAKVKVGEWSYPSFEEILMLIKELTTNVIDLDATALARQVTENAKTMNMIMLGVLVGLGILPIGLDSVRKVTEEMTGRFAGESVQALEAGFKIGEQRQADARISFGES